MSITQILFTFAWIFQISREVCSSYNSSHSWKENTKDFEKAVSVAVVTPKILLKENYQKTVIWNKVWKCNMLSTQTMKLSESMPTKPLAFSWGEGGMKAPTKKSICARIKRPRSPSSTLETQSIPTIANPNMESITMAPIMRTSWERWSAPPTWKRQRIPH